MKAILNKVSDALDKACGAVIVVMMAAMVILTAAQIVCRTWFTALSWSDEVTRYLLIWSTFLGATCVYRHNGNIAITFVQDAMPEPMRRAMRILVHAVCCVLFAVLMVYGGRYCMKLRKTATALPIKMKYIFLCVPVSMGVCMFHAFVMVLDEFKPAGAKEAKT